MGLSPQPVSTTTATLQRPLFALSRCTPAAAVSACDSRVDHACLLQLVATLDPRPLQHRRHSPPPPPLRPLLALASSTSDLHLTASQLTRTRTRTPPVRSPTTTTACRPTRPSPAAAMDSPGTYPESLLDQDDVVYPCKGCGEILEEGKAFELGTSPRPPRASTRLRLEL